MNKKSAVVFGGTSGIGKQTANNLLSNGWKVAIVGRKISDRPIKGAQYIKADITNEEETGAAINEATTYLETIDAVIYTVGNIAEPKQLEKITEKQWNETFQTCFHSAIRIYQMTIEKIRAAKGSYVFVSSVASTKPYTGIGDYCSAKAALDSLVRSIAAEEGIHGVRANSVQPAVIDTPLFQRSGIPVEIAAEWHALKRIGSPSDVANLIAYLASEEAKWLTGSHFVIDGGMSVTR